MNECMEGYKEAFMNQERLKNSLINYKEFDNMTSEQKINAIDSTILKLSDIRNDIIMYDNPKLNKINGKQK